MSGRLERLQRQVRRESPSEQVAQEACKQVEEDERAEDGTAGENGIRLWHVRLLLKLVETCQIQNS